MPDDARHVEEPVTVKSGGLRAARDGLMNAEALASYLKDPHPTRNQNADVVVPAIAEQIIQELSAALEAIE